MTRIPTDDAVAAESRGELAGLIERLRAADEYDAELEAAIWLAVLPGASPDDDIPWITVHIDAAIDLVERALPDANCMGIERDPQGWTAYVSRNCVPSGHWYREAQAPTAPRAILLALLLAKDSTHE